MKYIVSQDLVNTCDNLDSCIRQDIEEVIYDPENTLWVMRQVEELQRINALRTLVNNATTEYVDYEPEFNNDVWFEEHVVQEVEA